MNARFGLWIMALAASPLLFVACGDDEDPSGGGAKGGSAMTRGTSGEGGASGAPGGESELGGASGEGGGAANGGLGPTEPTPEASGLGKLGDPCDEAGAQACADHAQRQQLLCQAGFWTGNGACPSGHHCDTREGPTQGLCQPILEVCADEAAEALVCDENQVVRCGPDRVSTNLVKECDACDVGSCYCPPGTFADSEDFAACSGCPSGFFSAEPNLLECKKWRDCQAGSRVSNSPSAAIDRVCETCGPGSFSSGLNQSECLPAGACPAGTVQIAPGSGSTPPTCEDCEPGTYCAGGTAAAAPCSASTWDDDNNPATVCVNKTTCQPGQYISSAGTSMTDRTCSSCAAGSHSSSTNAMSCSSCAVGTFSSEGASSCTSCAAGTYSAAGVSSCTTCAAGTYSAAGASSCTTCAASCSAGTYQSTTCTATTNRVCTTCASGSYSTTTNASSCTTCLAACSAAAGTYESAACSATTNRVCTSFPSCQGPTAPCGSSNDNCCTSPTVTGGTFYRGNTTSYPANVSTFALDKYEVTAGRFRKFLVAYTGAPAAGAGAHPLITGSGWDSGWNGSIAANASALATAVQCDATYQTWSSTGVYDHLPMNCVSWFEAFAFCAWDGGRLPTEAEWEYAAAGGAEERTYPWGATAPSATHAVYDCTGDGSLSMDCAFADILRVGSKPSGAGKYGQLDLAGSMWEWNLDWYLSPFGTPCNDCAQVAAGSSRVYRGGGWNSVDSSLTAANRSSGPPTLRGFGSGIRCARTP